MVEAEEFKKFKVCDKDYETKEVGQKFVKCCGLDQIDIFCWIFLHFLDCFVCKF